MPPIYSQPALINNQLISDEIRAFIIDRQASHKSQCTIKYYQGELERLVNFLQPLGVAKIKDLQPVHIREYLIELSSHRNPGGCHAAYRAIRAFILWYAVETDDIYYDRFIKKITPPKVSNDPIPGITIEQFKALVNTCDRTFIGLRDRAILFALLDTGLRAFEFLKLNIGDINFDTGAIIVKDGKGNKNRVVFIHAVATKEILRYLRYYPNQKPISPLWLNELGKRLKYFGLREMLRRRAAEAKIAMQSPHDFRRAFGVESWRNGADLESIRRLMGHSDIKTTERYLNIDTDDLRKAHESSSPADNL